MCLRNFGCYMHHNPAGHFQKCVQEHESHLTHTKSPAWVKPGSCEPKTQVVRNRKTLAPIGKRNNAESRVDIRWISTQLEPEWLRTYFSMLSISNFWPRAPCAWGASAHEPQKPPMSCGPHSAEIMSQKTHAQTVDLPATMSMQPADHEKHAKVRLVSELSALSTEDSCTTKGVEL